MSSMRLSTAETVRFEYDNLKRPVRLIRGDNTSVRATYDARDRVTSTTDGRGLTTTFTYDGNGRRTAVRDASQAQTRIAYDGDNRASSLTGAVNQAWRLAYDPAGRPAGVTDPAGVEQRVTYDRRGQASALADAAGTVATVTRDAEGAPKSVTNGAGQTWSVETDARRRPVAVADPAGNRVRLAWNSANQVTSVTDALGNSSRFSYDAAGRPRRMTQPEGETTTLGYNADSRVNQVTDPRGNAWKMERDGAGRAVSRTDPAGAATRYEYNARGRLSKIIRADNSTAAFIYDENGRLIREDYSDGTQVSYTRDNLGRILRANGVALAYDAAGRIVESNGVRNEYDGAGRITAIHYDASRTLRYSYNNRGLLARMTDWAGRSWEFEYDAARRPVRDRAPNGVVTTYNYGADGRLSGIAYAGARLNVAAAFQRDANGRLVGATGDLPAPGLTAGTREFAFAPNNRMQGREYDGRGNTTRDGERRLTWNGRNLLTRASSPAGEVTVEYDAFGSPTRIGDAQYVWNYATQPPMLMDVRPAAGAAPAARAAGRNTETRVYTLGVMNRFVLDDANRWLHPHAITKYGNLFYLELFGAGRPAVTGLVKAEAPNDLQQFFDLGPGGTIETNQAGERTGTSVASPLGDSLELSGANPFVYLNGRRSLVLPDVQVAIQDGGSARDTESGSGLWAIRDESGAVVWDAGDDAAHYERTDPMLLLGPEGAVARSACGGGSSPERDYQGVLCELLAGPLGAVFSELAHERLAGAPIPGYTPPAPALLTVQEPVTPGPKPGAEEVFARPASGGSAAAGTPTKPFSLSPPSAPFIAPFDDVARLTKENSAPGFADIDVGHAARSRNPQMAQALGAVVLLFFGEAGFSEAEQKEINRLLNGEGCSLRFANIGITIC
jgi:YD repeat-containing protein